MIPKDLPNGLIMDLRHIRYFLAVAEELNFRRAAERLHISQPPLSVTIHDLERELGAQLFDRTKKQVFLTEAGRLLLQHARQIQDGFVAAKQAVSRLSRGEEGSLRVALTQSAQFLPFVPDAIQHFRASHPRVELSLQEMESGAQVEGIAQHFLDLGICRNPTGRQLPGVEMKWLCAHPLVVALHASNPLARRDKLTVADLREQQFVLSGRDSASGFLHKTVMDLCWAAGFVPTVALEVREVSTVIGLVASGLGIAIVPASLACIAMRNVRYLAIAGRGTGVDLFMATPKAGTSAHALVLQQLLEQAASGSEPVRKATARVRAQRRG